MFVVPSLSLSKNAFILCFVFSFFATGNLIVKMITHKTITTIISKHMIVWLVITAILTSILLIGVQDNGYVSMGHNCLGDHTWLFYMNAFVGSLSTIIFSVVLSVLFQKGIFKIVINYIRWLGNNSFYAMASHLPIKAGLLLIPAKMLHTDTGQGLCSNIWISLAAFIATLIVTSVVIQLINKSKIYYGRYK